MLRNNQSRFAQNPQLEMQRSTFDRPHGVKTTFNAGDLIPIYVNSDILPGDTVTMDMSYVTRMSTPIHPVFGNANLELFWFFVPHRLVWDDFEHFITGGLDAGEWDAPTIYEHPAVRPRWKYPLTGHEFVGFDHKSLADYMGLPVGFVTGEGGSLVSSSDIPEGVNALPFRAYAKIWNDWFRASSIQKEVLIPKTSGLVDTVHLFLQTSKSSYDGYTQVYSNGNLNFFVKNDSSVYGGSLLKANKYHDFFTSALLEPQRGEPVGIPLEGSLPVTTPPASFAGTPYKSDTNYPALRVFSLAGGTSAGVPNQDSSWPVGFDSGFDLITFAGAGGEDFTGIVPANLIVDADTGSLQVSINDLRHALAVQHILEIDARAGSGRYIDLLKGHFGVTSPDARLQRSEYLGGTSVPINVDQVLQTSATNDVSPQGNTAAFSLTAGSDGSFTKSFVEHGTLMCLACVRHVHTYQQGLNKMWSRKDRYDYYWPALNGISEQAILNKELYVSGDPEEDNKVFGYQEAWAEYRYHPDLVTGAMRSSYPQSLDVWHYADDYDQTPHLSPEWLQEGREEIDRTLAVSSAVEDQFIGDFYFNSRWYRVMPVYSVPGLDRL